jgi:hypothetical protein
MRQIARRVLLLQNSSMVSAQWRPGVSAGISKLMRIRLGVSTSLEVRLSLHLTLNGRNIPFVNNAKYLGVIFDRKITWRLHIEMIETKAFRSFIRAYSLFKSELLSANIILTLHKALIRSVMTYASPAWEFAADIHLMKLQHLQNKVPPPLAIIQGAHRFAICTWLSKSRSYMIT